MSRKPGPELNAFELRRKVEMNCYHNLKKLPDATARQQVLRNLSEALTAELVPKAETPPASVC